MIPLGPEKEMPLWREGEMRFNDGRICFENWYSCASCHQEIPRKFYTRVMNPEHNSFLLAPLAQSAGGTQKCSQAQSGRWRYRPD